MKLRSTFLILIFIMIICLPLFVQADVTNSTAIGLVSTAGSIISNVKENK